MENEDIRQNFSIQKPYLILCEGVSDRAFFRALMKDRNIQGYQTIHPVDLGAKRGGHSYWKFSLNQLIGATGFEILKGLIIATDNDNDMTTEFNKVQNALQDVSAFQSCVPSKPYEIKRSDSLKLSIMVMPEGGELGSLETLLLSVAEKNAPPEIKACIDKYHQCSGYLEFSPSQKAKACLRSYVACRLKKKPEISLVDLWEKDPNIVPVSDSTFDNIANHLKLFQN